jgi:pimeloyl-ACP methyl ester carboxylesterase
MYTRGPDSVVHHGFVTQSGKRMVVVLRGTMDRDDWFLNLLSGEPSQTEHIGYGILTDSLAPVTRDFIRQCEASGEITELIVVGHSLGGGVARVLLSRLASVIPSTWQVRLYTFGAPAITANHIGMSAYVRFQTVGDLFATLNQTLYDHGISACLVNLHGDLYQLDGSDASVAVELVENLTLYRAVFQLRGSTDSLGLMRGMYANLVDMLRVDPVGSQLDSFWRRSLERNWAGLKVLRRMHAMSTYAALVRGAEMALRRSDVS